MLDSFDPVNRLILTRTEHDMDQTEQTVLVTKRHFFVVETSMERRPHHGLHTNTSTHVLTEIPKGSPEGLRCNQLPCWAFENQADIRKHASCLAGRVAGP